MKGCPDCKTVYADDLFYCLQDGTPLTGIRTGVDPSARTELAYNAGRSQQTEVLPRISPPPPSLPAESTKASSKLPYVAIASLTLACITLAGAMIVLNLDRILPAKETKTSNTDGQVRTATPMFTSAMTSSPTPANSTAISLPVVKQPSVTVNPAGKWKGQWSTPSGTLADIEITLSSTQNNGVDGQIKWILRKTVRPDKMGKIGLPATELVRGNFDPATGSLKISGYDKDDPDNVLVMVDDYRLTVSHDGRTLGGQARNGGKWNGKLRLSR